MGKDKDSFELEEEQSNEGKAAENIIKVLKENEYGNDDPPALPEKKCIYIRLDVTGYKEYLQTMAGYDTAKSGKKVSITKYIQSLIIADMEARKEEYKKIKSI